MTIEQTRDQIVDQFSSVLNEAENLLSKATHETGEKAKDLRSQAEARLLSAKLKLQELQGQAVDKAKSVEVDKVRKAVSGQTFAAPCGFTLKMDETNHHLWKPVMIGSWSSFSIVPRPCVSAIVAFDAFDRFTNNVSSGSSA